ncbi:hypothetical protein [Pantoea stewartii]|uniref:Uncharacterized protein n=1 Tax=Pantoea stewartii subsp. stewartii DC283 TaxID=660596 RepID=A0ABN4Z632_PANSE|nr:hypothetical protein [Pantoea stewartii]ARF52200.1 hypothetical protein DSJ_23335 [Pantoea stewartii subsp. stewartii DC283]KAB0547359.1 hypothetical protein F7Q90_21250 [Pantoea stewartii subsp. stewartii]
MRTTRKSKGDVNFYLEKEGDVYHFLKTVKIQVANKETKTKRMTVSNFKFNKTDSDNINFSENGLRSTDKKYLLQMISDLEVGNE